jgi:hypothetical protein
MEHPTSSALDHAAIDRIVNAAGGADDLDKTEFLADLDWAATWYRVGLELRAGKSKRFKKREIVRRAAKRLRMLLQEEGRSADFGENVLPALDRLIGDLGQQPARKIPIGQ